MKKLVLLFALGAGSVAFACDCQKNKQAASACTCGTQSCPGQCNHADAPKTEKKKERGKKS